MKIVKLKPFQLEGCRQIYRFGGKALLADEQGLGKTIQSLYWAHRIPSFRPVVIVCPASIKWTWQIEALDHFGIRAQVLEGRYPNQDKKLTGSFFIINYEILGDWLYPLGRIKPQVVILDECQFIKNTKAQRTRAARKLCRKARSILALSGTPLTNRPEELWSVLHIIKPDLFPERTLYRWRYCKPRWTKWGWKFDGADRLQELHGIIRKSCMIRRLKKDVLTELPDKIHKVVPFQLSREAQREYNRAKEGFLKWLFEQSPSKAKRAKRAEAVVKIGYLLRLCARLKLDWVYQWLDDFQEANPGEKVVGMSMHTFVIEDLMRKYPASVAVYGKVTGRQRTESVRRFQCDRRVPFLFGNWKAGGLGLTMTASSTFVSIDPPWTAGDLAQGQDRVHRIGQKKKVIVYYLVCLGTVEEKLMKGLQKKKEILDAVLDGRDSHGDFDILGNLIKEMRN